MVLSYKGKLGKDSGLPHENSLAAHFVILGLEKACFPTENKDFY
jgi:hypothetical protein